MKKIMVAILILLSSHTVMAEGGFFNRLFKSIKTEDQAPEKVKIIKKYKYSDEEYNEESNQNYSYIPVVEGENIPDYIVLEYSPKETPEQRISFQVPVTTLQKGDRRPAEIAALEKQIANEKIKEKVVSMMKYYEKLFSRHLDNISDNPEKIYLLGNQYFLNAQYEKAKNIFSKNIDTIDNLFGAATTNRFLGYYNNAIDYYSEIIDRNPNLAEPFLGRGICYRNLGRYDEALSDFIRYKSMKDTEEAYSGLGNVYLLLGNYNDAKRILTDGRMKYPNSDIIKKLLFKAYGD